MLVYNQINSPFQYVVLWGYKSLLRGNLVQTESVSGDADPLSLSAKWEAYSRMKCPAWVRVAAPAKKHIWTEVELSHLNQVRLSSPGWERWGLVMFDKALKNQHCQRDIWPRSSLTWGHVLSQSILLAFFSHGEASFILKYEALGVSWKWYFHSVKLSWD